MLEAASVQIRRGDRLLLDRVNLTLTPGELVGIIGPNGAGKSTLLRVLAGLLMPDEGEARLDGEPIQTLDRWHRARRIAYLPQGGRAEWAISVRELVSLGRVPHGLRPGLQDETAVERAMARMDIEAQANRPVTTLSGGERAGVLLARALAVEADYLLADEPTLSLDPQHQLRLMDELAKEAAAGRGVAVILHDLSHALRYCHRLLLLDQGREAASGPPHETLSDARVAEHYGIDVIRGEHNGIEYIVPWQLVPPKDTLIPR